jgi:hypothetical protein
MKMLADTYYRGDYGHKVQYQWNELSREQKNKANKGA